MNTNQTTTVLTKLKDIICTHNFTKSTSMHSLYFLSSSIFQHALLVYHFAYKKIQWLSFILFSPAMTGGDAFF